MPGRRRRAAPQQRVGETAEARMMPRGLLFAGAHAVDRSNRHS